MPAIMEARLRKEAAQKGLSGEQADAYVYGTLAKLKLKSQGQDKGANVNGAKPTSVKSANRGLLHQHLGIKVGSAIPLGRLMKAKRNSGFNAMAKKAVGPAPSAASL